MSEKRILSGDSEDSLVCPCGVKFYICMDPLGVIHELPMCEKFQNLEPHEFLRYVRQATTGITDN